MKRTTVSFWLLVTILLAMGEARIDSASSDLQRSNFAEAAEVSGWPMFHHDPSHAGYTTSQAPKNNSVRWRYRTGDWIHSSPSIADGLVFFASEDNNVYALDEMTGALMWNHSCGDKVQSSPAVADGMVFVGSYDHNVYALNEVTGETIWTYETEDEVLSSSTVADGMVFVTSSDDRVYSLNEFTGEEIWRREIGLGYARSSPAVADGMVFIGAGGGNIYALNESTGTEVWSYKDQGRPIDCSPAVADGLVFIAEYGGVCALNETTGARIWKFNTDTYMSSSPAVADGMIFFGAWPQGMYALNETTGDLIWKIYPEIGSGFSSPAVADNMVFIGEFGGSHSVYALDEFTGTVIWRYSTLIDFRSSPAIADGMMFIGVEMNMTCFGPRVNVKPVLHTINPSNDTVVSSSDVEFSWDCTYIISIDHYSVRIDNEPWIDVGDSNTYTFQGLADGNHTAYIQAVDRGGLNSAVSVRFTVNILRSTPETVAIVGALITMIVALSYIVIKKSGILKNRKQRSSTQH